MLRKAVLIAFSCIGSAEAASIYKCVDDKGRVEFSQSPCSDAAERLTIDVPNIGTEGSTNARVILDEIKKAHRPREIDREIKTLERDISGYQKEMDTEMRLLRGRKKYAANNLAGATWEESISTEMSAVVASFKTKIENARVGIRNLRDEKDKIGTR